MTELMRFDGQVALITGAARGLGREHALLLASRGAAVVVNDIGYSTVAGGEKASRPADDVVAEIRSAGGKAVANYADVASQSGCEEMVSQALDHFGGIDIVISNAGTSHRRPFLEMTEEDFDIVIKPHLYGSFHTVKAAWPHLIKRKYGRVVLTTSGVGLLGFEEALNYGAAKAGIYGMMRTLALEGAAHGIHTNAFWPSAHTRMMPSDKEMIERMQRTMPVSLTTPVAAWLCHHSCSENGKVFHAGSGRVSNVFVAETQGYCNLKLTMEDLAEHREEIFSRDDFLVFDRASDSSLEQTAIVNRYREKISQAGR